MAYEDDLLNDDERIVPADTFGERIGNADLGENYEDLTVDDTPSTDNMSEEEAGRGFRERLDSSDSFEDDFTSSLNPDENPHLSDQLDDDQLQHDGDDYR
jgi:hypothetical protein